MFLGHAVPCPLVELPSGMHLSHQANAVKARQMHAATALASSVSSEPV